MFSPRIFKRLEVAKSSGNEFFHEFFLKRMAYLQWSNAGAQFTSGPLIIAEEGRDEYSYWKTAQEIESSLEYYMKPHKLYIFGNDVKNTNKSHILSRLWLHSNKDINIALVLMERIDYQSDKLNCDKYMTAINNRTWMPLDWSDIEKTSELEQTLVKSDNPYPGCWDLHIRLEGK